MDREEAIRKVESCLTDYFPMEDYGKVEEIIKVLKQEPYEDAISRKAMLDYQQYLHGKMPNEENYKLWKFIKDLPSVMSKTELCEDAVSREKELKQLEEQTRWIPCSKRLPKKSGEYWCTFGKTNLMGSDYYTTESDAKKIFDDPEEYVGWQSHNVIAWMPLPEKYKAETPVTSTPKWVPCSKQLPKEDEYYLVQNEYGDMLVAKYVKKDYWEEIYSRHKLGATDKIVAWMPLPKKYKAETKKGENRQ